MNKPLFIDRCFRCNQLVDPEDDVDCYDSVGVCVCNVCRNEFQSNVETKGGDELCAGTGSHEPAPKASDVPVSPAISLAISPSTDEKYITESDGNQPSNQSGNKRNEKPSCFTCIHSGPIPGDAHIECRHPIVMADTAMRFLTPILLMSGNVTGIMKRMNVRGDPTGVRNGWFMWPINFDPGWLETCDRYESRNVEG